MALGHFCRSMAGAFPYKRYLTLDSSLSFAILPHQGSEGEEMASRKAKRKFLEAAGALNPHPERVTDEKFQLPEGFFDPVDKVQVKYEMLRANGVEGESVSEAARRFGYTRESFYQNLERFEGEGVIGLTDRKRGRKGPVKLTGEVLEFVRQQREADPRLSGERLAGMVDERFGVQLHRRTVEKAFGGAGSPQKKTEGIPGKKKGTRRPKRRKSS